MLQTVTYSNQGCWIWALFFIEIIPNESQSVRPRCFVGAELTENTFLSDTSTATKISDKKNHLEGYDS